MKFNPDWYSPPGDTIKDILIEKKIFVEYLAVLIDIPLHECFGLLSGETIITKEIAKKLSEVLGVTPQFWLNLEFNYRKYKALNLINE